MYNLYWQSAPPRQVCVVDYALGVSGVEQEREEAVNLRVN